MPASSLQKLDALWDQLADFPVARTDAALRHLMETVCGWIGADNSVWVAAVRLRHGAAARRDSLHGWRARHYVPLRVKVPGEGKLVRDSMRKQESEPPLTSCAMARLAGQFRVHRLRDGFVDFQAFRRTPHYQLLYKGRGIDDRIWVGFPVNADAESFFLFDKWDTRRRFSRADVALAGRALRHLKSFHRRLLLSHGLTVGGRLLSPAERRVLSLLLTDCTEKEAAAQLGLTWQTAHRYVVDIYRKFGVNSRAGLMALWLKTG